MATDGKLHLIYFFCRLQMPGLALDAIAFNSHLRRMFDLFHAKEAQTVWDRFLEAVHALDAFLASACLEGDELAWQTLLFDVRVGKQERRLADALRARAIKLYPGNEERQNAAVDDFWGHLIVSESAGSVPILRRYDGQRPLVPWLIRIFQNWQISKLRGRAEQAEPLDPDGMLGDSEQHADPNPTWHDAFRSAAQDWLRTVAEDEDLLLLGLLWRYRLSQREVAKLLKVHEGTISRRVKQLAEKCLEYVAGALTTAGWMGDDLGSFLYSEMASVLLDEPRLSADNLARFLRMRGKTPPSIPA